MPQYTAPHCFCIKKTHSLLQLSGNSILEKKSTIILASCEAYGRLAAHKQATKNELPNLSPQLRKYLNLVTDEALPSLISTSNAQKPSSLEMNLSISRISMIEDLNSPGPFTALSPMAKVQRNTPNTTEYIEGKRHRSFESAMNRLSVSDIHEKVDNMVLRSNAAAISLLKSAILILSEWLAVGGSDGDEIANICRKWCKVLEIQNNEINIRDVLFPAFGRLSLQLIKSSENFSVFREMIIACDDFSGFITYKGIMQNIVQNVLKSQSPMPDLMVQTIFDGAKALKRRKEITLDENQILRFLTTQSHGLGHLITFLVKCLSQIEKENPEKNLDEANFLLQLCKKKMIPSSHIELKTAIEKINTHDYEDTPLASIISEMLRCLEET